MSKSMTLRQAVSAATEQLRGNKDLESTAARDAELLLLHALCLPRSTLFAYPGRLLSAKEQELFASTVERRLHSEPIQYITGTQEFFGLEFEVGPGVLIPRPETELLVQAVLDRLPHDRPVSVLDVGTGSGAIAIAIASRLPNARVTAVDVSPAALEIAGRNVRRHGLEGRVELVVSDLLQGLPLAAGRFNAVVSNPPYVPEVEREGMHPQVREFEPAEALFGGSDGLAVYRRLIPEARAALQPQGLLAMEIGFGQSLALAELLGGWRGVNFLPDLQGIPRVVVARSR